MLQQIKNNNPLLTTNKKRHGIIKKQNSIDQHCNKPRSGSLDIPAGGLFYNSERKRFFGLRGIFGGR